MKPEERLQKEYESLSPRKQRILRRFYRERIEMCRTDAIVYDRSCTVDQILREWDRQIEESGYFTI